MGGLRGEPRGAVTAGGGTRRRESLVSMGTGAGEDAEVHLEAACQLLGGEEEEEEEEEAEEEEQEVEEEVEPEESQPSGKGG